jgi:hypothetical protein
MNQVKPLAEKKKKHPLRMLGYFLGAFLLLSLFLLIPSARSSALRALENCSNAAEVKQVWTENREDLGKDETFLSAVRDKLSGMNLSEAELTTCRQWLPPAPISLNLIVVPDLSRRLQDSPGQLRRDTAILNMIWTAFREFSRFRTDTRDRLVIDVTEEEQASGNFSAVADRLHFDLSAHKGKSNRLYFTPALDREFYAGVQELYRMALSRPLGADYHFYFNRNLGENLMKSDLKTTWLNRVIIITDGYLEPEDRAPLTIIEAKKDILYAAVDQGRIGEVMQQEKLAIPPVDLDLSGTDVLVCEVKERESGKRRDFDILRTYWSNWLDGMKVRESRFIDQKRMEIMRKNIQQFIHPKP